MGKKRVIDMELKHFYIILAVLVLAAGCKNNAQPASEPVESEQQTETDMKEIDTNLWADLGEEPLLKISTTDGDMTVKLYKETPLHRDNFVKLAKKGFYDNILFHRIINGFMIQCGDPLTKDSTQIARFGTGGPGYTIPAEIKPEFTHKKGALAAARRGDAVNLAKESSGSQFYIVQSEAGCSHLDGEYTIFGEVVEGLPVIDVIAAEPTDQRDRPLKKVEILSIAPARK